MLQTESVEPRLEKTIFSLWLEVSLVADVFHENLEFVLADVSSQRGDERLGFVHRVRTQVGQRCQLEPKQQKT